MNKTDAVIAVAALHEQVRSFIQERYPDQIVVDIEQHARSRYRFVERIQEYVMFGRECEFVVDSINKTIGGHCYRFRLSLLEDNSLRISDEQPFMDYPRGR